jgi:hypothetical protein
MMPDRKFLYQGEDVKIVWQEILVLLFQRVLRRDRARWVVQERELSADLQFRDEVGVLEIGSEITILGNVCEKLQGHENVFIPRHRGQDALGGGRSVLEIGSIGVSGQGRRVDVGGNRVKAQRAVGLDGRSVDDAAIDNRPVGDVECLRVLGPRRIRHGQPVRIGDFIQHGITVTDVVDFHGVLYAHDRLGHRLRRVIIIYHRRILIPVGIVGLARAGSMLPKDWSLPSRSRWRDAPGLDRSTGGSWRLGLRCKARLQSR